MTLSPSSNSLMIQSYAIVSSAGWKNKMHDSINLLGQNPINYVQKYNLIWNQFNMHTHL